MHIYKWASQVALVVKKPHANAGELRDSGSTLGSRKSLAGRYGNPLPYSYLEDPMVSISPFSSINFLLSIF